MSSKGYVKQTEMVPALDKCNQLQHVNTTRRYEPDIDPAVNLLKFVSLSLVGMSICIQVSD